MPFKTVNERGEEIEAYTAQELKAEREAAIEEYRQANPGDPDIERLQDEIQTKTEELEKLKSKDYNFARLRQDKEKLEKEIASLNTSIDEKIGNVKKEVVEGVMQDYYKEKLVTLAGNDKDLADKIEFQYKRLTDPGTNKEEINKKLNDAFLLATGEGQTKVSLGAFSSRGVSPLGAEAKQPVTEEEKEFARKMAKAGGIELKEEDFDKAK